MEERERLKKQNSKSSRLESSDDCQDLRELTGPKEAKFSVFELESSENLEVSTKGPSREDWRRARG